MDKIDLEEVERVADYYEKRKQTMIELGALKDPAYLATLAEGEAIKAFEALRPLVERVRKLERTLKILEGYRLSLCSCAKCPLGETCRGTIKHCISEVIAHAMQEASNER